MKKTTWQDWLVFLCGIIVFGFGIAVIFMPQSVLYAVGILAGIGILLQGVSRVVRFFKGSTFQIPSGLVLFGGIIDLIFGVLVLMNVQATAAILCLLVGFWFLFGSVMRIALSFELKRAGAQKWWLILILGIICTILSFFVIWNPIAGAAVIVISVSISLISSGLMIIAEAFSNR